MFKYARQNYIISLSTAPIKENYRINGFLIPDMGAIIKVSSYV